MTYEDIINYLLFIPSAGGRMLACVGVSGCGDLPEGCCGEGTLQG